MTSQEIIQQLGEPWNVSETPDEIIALIEQAKKARE